MSLSAAVRRSLVLAGAMGALAVLLGAFGAHGLSGWLAGMEDAEQRAQWWQTAAHYHLVHAVALLGLAWVADRRPGRAATVATWSFFAGIALFSGSLYAMTLTGVRALGAITPIGGLALVAGWIAVAVAAIRPARER